MILIEQNVTPPEDVELVTFRDWGRPAKYPFDYLKVGDSFTAPVEKAASIAVACSRQKKKSTKRFIARKDKEIVRVWRVK